MAELVVTEKKYTYLKIPTKYIAIYHQICELMVDFGEDILKDCKANCNDKNIEIQKCFNIFNAALMAHSLGKTKYEKTLIKYLKAKLKQFNHDICSNFTIMLEDGITGYVDCTQDPPVIYIDPDETPETPEENDKIAICLIVKPLDFIDFRNYQEYAERQIIESNIISSSEINLNYVDKFYEIKLEESKLMFVILIPNDSYKTVKLDDGFGNKVDFGSSDLWYSNGDVNITYNGIVYKVYGELYTISSVVKYYINTYESNS